MLNGMVMVIMWVCRVLDIMACLGIRDGFNQPKQQGWLLHLVMGGDDRYNRMIVGVWGMIDAFGLALSGLWITL
jgi:hypothetical protein